MQLRCTDDLPSTDTLGSYIRGYGVSRGYATGIFVHIIGRRFSGVASWSRRCGVCKKAQGNWPGNLILLFAGPILLNATG